MTLIFQVEMDEGGAPMVVERLYPKNDRPFFDEKALRECFSQWRLDPDRGYVVVINFGTVSGDWSLSISTDERLYRWVRRR